MTIPVLPVQCLIRSVYFRFHPEGEILLRKITEQSYNNRGKALGDSRKQMDHTDKEMK